MKEMFADLSAQVKLCFLNDDRWKMLVKGLGATLQITAVALLIGIVLGIIVAAVRSSYEKNKETMKAHGGIGYVLLSIANAICKLYLTIIRGTPTVVQLLIFYFIIFAKMSDGVPVAMICFGINSGAYVAEIFRSGIMSTDNGQFEAGRSLGFSYIQTMRYIVIPQAFKTVLPTLCNEFIVLIKETSIAGYVAVTDLTKAAEAVKSRTFNLIPHVLVAVVYLAMVICLTQLQKRLERRLARSDRG